MRPLLNHALCLELTAWTRTPLEWCLHVGDIASAICLLGSPNASLKELRTTVSLERIEQVLDAGADVEYRIGPKGRTFLLQEAAEGRHLGVRLALDKGASVHCMDDNGDTALALALASAKPQAKAIVLDLLEAGSDLNTKNGQGQPLFNVALANASPEVLELVIATLSPLTDEHRDQMQSWAANSLVQDKKWSNRSCDVLRTLLGHGLDPNLTFQSPRYQGQGTSTLLDVAVQQQTAGGEVLVAELLEKGAKPNLHIALQSGSMQIIEIILTKLTPMEDSHRQQMVSWIKSLHAQPNRWRERDVEVLKLLLDFGLDPNLRHPSAPHSPLIICAACYGDIGLLQKLIVHGAQLDVKNDESDTPLICAAKNRHREIYDALKAAGLNDKYFLFGTVWGHHAGQ